MVNYFIVIFYAILVTLHALPRPDSQNAGDKSTTAFPPLLEFKNGGIRVNFAGYHAEAGLGGLFGGTGTRGGLFAGVGTPHGAHASANLGGVVDGEEGGSTGGGLHARAGLGNGGPEAAAGLGGNLAGANRGGNGGRLYAATRNAGRTRIVSKEIGPDQSNIQVIPKTTTLQAVQSPGESEIINDVTRRDAAAADEKINGIVPIDVPVIEPLPHIASPSRRCERKRRRVCHNYAKKTVIYQQLPNAQAPSDFVFSKPIPNAGFDGAILGEKIQDVPIPGLESTTKHPKDIVTKTVTQIPSN